MFLPAVLFASAAAALYGQANALPANYKTIYEDSDFLVMHVHYGPHEFVAMHDHTAYPTVYVYLNDSGEVELRHDGEGPGAMKRPPTHTGAFRIAPGVKERHSVQSLSDTPSDFLRVELKRIPPADLKHVFRGEAPSPSAARGMKTEFQDNALQVDRFLCSTAQACPLPMLPKQSLLVALNHVVLAEQKFRKALMPGEVLLLKASKAETVLLNPGAECLRIILKYP